MSSILTNASALTALQNLTATQRSLSKTQNEVSTGLRVADASDNSTYWSVATQMKSDNGVLGTVKDSLQQNSALLKTTTAALDNVVNTINKIKEQLTQAKAVTNGDLSTIHTTLGELGKTLKDTVDGAVFNGTNLLDGSKGSSIDIVSGFTNSKIETINVGLSSLYNTGAGTKTATRELASITDSTQVATIQGLTDTEGLAAGDPQNTPAYGETLVDLGGSNPNKVVVSTADLSGVVTRMEYTALDVDGKETTVGAAISFAVKEITETPAGTGALKQGTTDLTNLSGITQGGVDQAMKDVDAALKAVRTLAATFGAAQNRIDAQTTFISTLSDSLTKGVSAMVDADMNETSTRLQALQTQQQLGVQSLSIANQNSQMILKLFQ